MSVDIVDIDIKIPQIFLPWLFQDYTYKAAYGGRGSAKSHSFARAILMHAMRDRMRVVCAREIQRSIKDSVKSLLERIISWYALNNLFTIRNNEIICNTTGSEFLFYGLYRNIDSIKSIDNIKIIWVEEAQSVSQESIEILVPTLREEDAQLWFTWNPKTKNDPIGKMFLGNTIREGTFVQKVNFDANPWFPAILKREMEYQKAHSYDMYRHVWLGEPVVHTELRVLHNWRVENFETPEGADFLFGADWGFSVDPTVLVRFWLDGNRIYIDHEAYQVHCEIADTPALFDQVPGSRDWIIRADSASPAIISYLNNNGFNVVGSKKGKNSVEDGIRWLKDFDIIIHERCKHVADEFSLYSYKQHARTKEITPHLEDKNNHTIDALRYGSEPLHNQSAASFIFEEL